MKKTVKALKPYAIIIVAALIFVACDKDFSTIDSDVLGRDNANFNTNKLSFDVVAYNKALDAVRSNGLNNNLLGVYEDPLFGKTEASIVSQILPTSYNPNFGIDPKIDSVMLNIPYFSRVSGTDNDGSTTYVMNMRDSLYGDQPIILNIYQNNYFLRDFNPSSQTQESQDYYSFAENTPNGDENFSLTENTTINFDFHKGPLIGSDSLYVPSADPVEIVSGEELTFNPPALRIALDTLFWKNTIIAKDGSSELSNANNFRDYFRGLYIKAESKDNSTGNMQLINLAASNANIIIYYSKQSATNADERTNATYAFNFSGIRLNTYINNHTQSLVDGDDTNGDEKLNLKGMAGSMAVIDLFPGSKNNNGVPLALEALRNDFKDNDDNALRLINEARLVIYEDETLSDDDHRYDRIFAYDIKNNIPLIDFNFDPTENTNIPYNSKVIHLGQRDTIGESSRGYKIRITEHMKRLVFSDSLNTKIGLVMSNNVNYINSAKLFNSADYINTVPAVSQITPRGTIIYGNTNDVNKKMRLEIYYSEPKN